jgi:hypothetical protein
MHSCSPYVPNWQFGRIRRHIGAGLGRAVSPALTDGSAEGESIPTFDDTAISPLSCCFPIVRPPCQVQAQSGHVQFLDVIFLRRLIIHLDDAD